MLLFAALLAAVPSATATAAASRPNLIFLLFDDVSTHELGCYGNKQVKTPAFDALAREGLMFRSAWATPVCVPTRNEVMSGQYGFRNGAFENAIIDPVRVARMPSRHKPLSRALQEAGYRTFMGGKWHLEGRPWDKDWGFDEQFMFGSLAHPLEPEWVGAYRGEYWSWWNPAEKSRQEKPDHSPSATWHPMIIANGRFVPTKPEDFGPELLNRAVLAFLDRRVGKAEPFFIYYAEQLPHVPWDVMKNLKTGQKTTTGMQANVEMADQVLGRLVHKLRETGQWENTILMVAGDNPTYGLGKGAAGAIGAHVPFIVGGGGKWVRLSGPTDCLMDFTDLYATLADYAGVKPSALPPLDGRSFRPLLEGRRDYSREWIFSYNGPHRVLRTQDWCWEDGVLWSCRGADSPFTFTRVAEETAASRAARLRLETIARDLPPPDDALLGQFESGRNVLKNRGNPDARTNWQNNADNCRKAGVEKLLSNPTRAEVTLRRLK
jgi:arylsulfatase A